jgi:hypothetical protein
MVAAVRVCSEQGQIGVFLTLYLHRFFAVGRANIED